MGSMCSCCRSDIECEIVRLRLVRSHEEERLATQLIAHENTTGTAAAIRAISCAIYQLQHPNEPLPPELTQPSNQIDIPPEHSSYQQLSGKSPEEKRLVGT